KIAETAVSVSYAAVELAKKIFSDLRDKTVLLVGAGEMAKLAARHFIASGVRHVRVTTRTPQHAVALNRSANATACWGVLVVTRTCRTPQERPSMQSRWPTGSTGRPFR